MVRVVEENATDLQKYNLATPPIAVEFKAGSESGSLLLGDKNATQGEMYAVKNGEKRVFLVSSFQETNFNRTPFDLRDKKILKFDREKADTRDAGARRQHHDAGADRQRVEGVGPVRIAQRLQRHRRPADAAVDRRTCRSCSKATPRTWRSTASTSR